MVAPSKTSIPKKTRVRISKSGQVTLPASIRKQLGVGIGEHVDFVQGKDGTVNVRAVKLLSVDDLAGKVGQPLPSGTDLNELIRESTHEGMDRRFDQWRK